MASQIEKEFYDYESQQIWPQVYQKIKNDSSINSIQEKLSVGEARKPENRSKNRYRDVSPYDHSRVTLQQGDSDYINASLIKVPESGRTYILSQGPLEHTVGQFWQMIWEQDTKAVIMLNRVREKGTLKCHQYWPLGEDEEDEEMLFKEERLKVTLMEEQETQHFTIRTFDLENIQTQQVREVYHFHYTTWPDFGIPSSPISFLMFLQAVRDKGVLDDDYGPAVIHCSAGIGRSGTFCLVDSALVLIEKTGTMEGIDLCSLLLSMRSYRMGLIQTFDQLKFSYMAVIAGGKQITANSGAQQVNNVLDNYLEKEESDDEAPVPPQRVESLSPSKRRGLTPPPPPPRSFPVEDSTGEPTAKQQKVKQADHTHGPQKPPRAHSFETNHDTISVSHTDTVNTNIDQPPLPSACGIHGDQTRDSDVKDKSDSNQRASSQDTVENNTETADDSHVSDSQEHVGNSVDSSETQLRQRRRQEREKRKEKTQEIIKQMKEKQRTSEIWKKRQSYMKPVLIGLSVLLGTYLLYKWYTW